MNKKGLWVFLAVFFTFSFLTSLVYGAVVVTDQTGQIKITMPDGTETVVNAGETLPAIPDGATVEILSGSAVIEATGTSYVYIVVGSDTAQLDSGDKIDINFNPDTNAGSITLVLGTVNVITADGSTQTLDANNPTLEVVPPETAAEIPEVETQVETEINTGDLSPSS